MEAKPTGVTMFDKFVVSMKLEDSNKSDDDEASSKNSDWSLLSGIRPAIRSAGRKPVHGAVIDLRAESVWGVLSTWAGKSGGGNDQSGKTMS